MKKSVRFEDYLFLVGPGGAFGTIRELVAEMAPGPFAFVTAPQAPVLIEKYGPDLYREGCQHLLGTDYGGVWWYNFETENFDYTDICFDDPNSRTLGSFMQDEPCGNEWFVIRLLDKPFQIVTWNIGKRRFDFALVNGDPNRDLIEVFDELAFRYNVHPDAQRCFEFVAHCDPVSIRKFWDHLQENYGDIDTLVALDAGLWSYLGGNALLFGFEDDSGEDYCFYCRLIRQAARLEDKAGGYLIPLAGK